VSETERAAIQQIIDAYELKCFWGIDNTGTDCERILYVYDYIVNNTEYDLSAPHNQDISSVFVNGVSVCAGYAKATQYLLQKLGISCTFVAGTATGAATDYHGWNLVFSDGNYSWLDPTFGDPIYENGQPYGIVVYEPFLVTDDVFFLDHTADEKFPLPNCTSTECRDYLADRIGA
jgi:transglutaminase/protease-like cytokinesis protein 3